MKRIVFLVVGFLWLFSMASAQADVKDLGDICYSLDDGTFKPLVVMRLGVLFYGTGDSGHVVLNAPITANGGPAQGTAVMKGGNIIVSLNGSFDSQVASNGIVTTVSGFFFTHMVVDSRTLEGTYTTMVSQTAPPPAQTNNISGKARLFPCQ